MIMELLKEPLSPGSYLSYNHALLCCTLSKISPPQAHHSLFTVCLFTRYNIILLILGRSFTSTKYRRDDAPRLTSLNTFTEEEQMLRETGTSHSAVCVEMLVTV